MSSKAGLIFIILLYVTCFSKTSDSWFGTDKLRHFMLSAVTTGIVKHNLKTQTEFKDKNVMATAVSFTFSLGVAKEIRDFKSAKGCASIKDIIADVFGIGVGLLLP